MVFRGYVLLEWLVVLSIMGVLSMGIVVLCSQTIGLAQSSYCGAQSYQLTYLARLAALAYDRDMEIVLKNNQLSIAPFLRSDWFIPLPHDLLVSQTARMGFKGSGTTKYAGTLNLQWATWVQKVSVGVGYGKVGFAR